MTRFTTIDDLAGIEGMALECVGYACTNPDHSHTGDAWFRSTAGRDRWIRVTIDEDGIALHAFTNHAMDWQADYLSAETPWPIVKALVEKALTWTDPIVAKAEAIYT